MAKCLFVATVGFSLAAIFGKVSSLANSIDFEDDEESSPNQGEEPNQDSEKK